MGNNFPAVINHLHLHIQACSNINSLYRNLMIRLARRSWVAVCNPQTVTRVAARAQPKKLTKKQIKEKEIERRMVDMREKTAYLDIVPTKAAFADTYGGADRERMRS
jgi:hypothetical protein